MMMGCCVNKVMEDELRRDINNLLAHLRDFNVVELINRYYLHGFDNSAPGKLVEEGIDKLQKHLDNARRNTDTNILPSSSTPRK